MCFYWINNCLTKLLYLASDAVFLSENLTLESKSGDDSDNLESEDGQRAVLDNLAPDISLNFLLYYNIIYDIDSPA